MKTLLNIIALLTYLILLSICIANPEKLVWKIVLPCLMLYGGWLYLAYKNAKEMPKDYLD